MYKNMRKRSNILLHGAVHAVDQGNDAHQQEQPLPELQEQEWPSKPQYPASALTSVSVGILGVGKGQLRLQGFTTSHLLLTQTSEQGSEQIWLSP